MGVTTIGVIDTQEMLIQLDVTTKRRVARKLIEQGANLMKLAKAMAPRDHANLEEAIHMRPDPGSARARDEAGRFVRTEVEVYIDMSAPVPHRPGKTVGDYAYEIHEHQTPMGSIRLGDKSAQKQAMHPEVVVGGGFMVRAAEQVEAGLEAALLAALNEIL